MQNKTEVSLLRSNSQGLPGTLKNANHHAMKILPFIDILSKGADKLGFSVWRQGNNIHEFVTVEGTRYTLRAFVKDGAYCGVRLALRVSRSLEIRLIDIADVSECWRLLDVMRMLAQPAKGEDSGVMLSNKAA